VIYLLKRWKSDSVEGSSDRTGQRRLKRNLTWTWADGGTGPGGVSDQLAEGILLVMIPLWLQELTTLEIYYSSNLLFLIALASSKASVASLLLRLCAEERQKLLFVGALASNGLLLVASIFAMAFQCDVLHPWILVSEKCDGVIGQPRDIPRLGRPADLYSYFAGKLSEDWT
jgi:hypothetical protein